MARKSKLEKEENKEMEFNYEEFIKDYIIFRQQMMGKNVTRDMIPDRLVMEHVQRLQEKEQYLGFIKHIVQVESQKEMASQELKELAEKLLVQIEHLEQLR